MKEYINETENVSFDGELEHDIANYKEGFEAGAEIGMEHGIEHGIKKQLLLY